MEPTSARFCSPPGGGSGQSTPVIRKLLFLVSISLLLVRKSDLLVSISLLLVRKRDFLVADEPASFSDDLFTVPRTQARLGGIGPLLIQGNTAAFADPELVPTHTTPQRARC